VQNEKKKLDEDRVMSALAIAWFVRIYTVGRIASEILVYFAYVDNDCKSVL